MEEKDKQQTERMTFFRSWRDIAKEEIGDPIERCAFYDALMDFGLDGEEPQSLTPLVRIAFLMARPVLEKSANMRRYGNKNATKNANETQLKRNEKRKHLLEVEEEVEEEREIEVESRRRIARVREESALDRYPQTVEDVLRIASSPTCGEVMTKAQAEKYFNDRTACGWRRRYNMIASVPADIKAFVQQWKENERKEVNHGSGHGGRGVDFRRVESDYSDTPSVETV